MAKEKSSSRIYFHIVLAQVHRDPLRRVKKLRKLECFNKERFKELKKFFKETSVFLKEGKYLSYKNGAQQKEEDNYKLDYERDSRVQVDKENKKAGGILCHSYHRNIQKKCSKFFNSNQFEVLT